MNSFSRGVRNAFRNGVRTIGICLILALMIGLTLAMLVASQAVEQKISEIKSSIGNNITVQPAGSGEPGGGMMRRMAPGSTATDQTGTVQTEQVSLNSDDVTKIKQVSHIVSVSAALSTSVSDSDTTLTPLEFSPRADSEATTGASTGDSSKLSMPINVTGADSEAAAKTSVRELTLSSGAAIDYDSSDKVALVGDQLAEQNNLQVGSTFELYGEKFSIKGIMSSGDSDSTEGRGRSMASGSGLIVPLKTLQGLGDNTGKVSQVLATVDNVENTDAAVTAIESALGQDDSGNNVAEVTSDKESADSAVESLASMKNTSLFGVIICAVIAAAVIFLAMLMVVRERRNEIGIMKAIGAKSRVIVTQFVAESLVITLVASVVGLGIGVLVATPLTNAITSSSESTESNTGQPGEMPSDDAPATSDSNSSSATSRPSGKGPGAMMDRGARQIGQVVAQINWSIVGYALVGALVIAAIGAVAASAMAMRIKPAEAVRAE